MVRVLMVESPDASLTELHYVLATVPQIELVGYARTVRQALTVAARRRPELVLVGLAARHPEDLGMVRAIAEGYHAPIVVLSRQVTGSEFQPPPEIIEAGAQARLPYPPRVDHPAHPLELRRLLEAIQLLAEIKVVRRRQRNEPPFAPAPAARLAQRPAVIAIGASTGGPAVLRALLGRLPADFPAPVLIVQHMAPGFIREFAAWLGEASACRVELATDGIVAEPGVVYVAPDDHHLGIGATSRLQLSGAPPEHGMRPAVSHLFRSVLGSFGADSAAVLLTGMGKDGAAELKFLKTAGAYTLIQDRASAAVYGMAGEALKLDAACAVLDPLAIGDALASLLKER